MKISKNAYVIAPMVIILILVGLFWSTDPLVWLSITIISGILPWAFKKENSWKYIHYVYCAFIALGIYYLLLPPEKEILDVMGELFPLGRTGYVVTVFIVSVAVYAFLSLTVSSVIKKLGRRRFESIRP